MAQAQTLGDLWKKWLIWLDSQFQEQILLQVDNFPAHLEPSEQPKLKNIIVKILPANTTAFLLPMDAGIINSFKAKF